MAATWWSPVSPCTPQECVTGEAPLVGRLSRLVRYAAALVVLLIGVVLAVPVAALCPPALRDSLVRAWMRSVAAAFGMRIRVPAPPAAREPGRGLLVVANHVSWMDILLIAAVIPGRNVAKAEIRGWPVIGPLCVLGRTIFIDRERFRTLPDTVAEVAEALRGGATVVAFPEGSTWCGREEGRFRGALFQAALNAGADVQPLRIDYRLADGTRSTAPAFVGADTLMDSVRRVVSGRGLTAEVAVLAPITAGTWHDRRALARAAHGAAHRAEVPAARQPAPLAPVASAQPVEVIELVEVTAPVVIPSPVVQPSEPAASLP
ncbi:lysophospholipid acyltransferase family protein [Streptomyces sp. MI02-7b]|uniref:lysophospholipid acyltransferase family protein n=1 Tax=Streptomyces sp. MI02-7b TaxID=462941 RepID=UPI0029B9344E|nr:lysophospholipid acyltransferase family protein [Streptomyces sp. MI02-7b]MDX3071418.1 lysophospholipid acyltransferase family protein [Streptomyces sp. MI02-7b]